MLTCIKEHWLFLLWAWSNAEELGRSVFAFLNIISCVWIYVNPSAVGGEGALLPCFPCPSHLPFSAAVRTSTESPSLLVLCLTLEDRKSTVGVENRGTFPHWRNMWLPLVKLGWLETNRQILHPLRALALNRCQGREPLGLRPQKCSLGACAKKSLFISFPDSENGPTEALSVFPWNVFNCLLY